MVTFIKPSVSKIATLDLKAPNLPDASYYYEYLDHPNNVSILWQFEDTDYFGFLPLFIHQKNLHLLIMLYMLRSKVAIVSNLYQENLKMLKLLDFQV